MAEGWNKGTEACQPEIESLREVLKGLVAHYEWRLKYEGFGSTWDDHIGSAYSVLDLVQPKDSE